MNFDVPYEDIVCGARSGSSSGRRLSSRRDSSVASALDPSVPSPLAVGSGPFAPPPIFEFSNHRFIHPSEEVRSRSVWTATAWSNFKHLLYNARKNSRRLLESRPDSLEGAHTDMDVVRLPTRFVQHMGRGEMARNLHNNESESSCQSRGQQAYKWEKELKRPLTFQEVFDKMHEKKGTDQYISDRTERLRSHIANR
ncbi:hypothetical protein Taro_041225 [Colocasia esculenta]|uniref:Uncharacterized protein n=1 Tax=Colocasia esculenta TaxID=4460 RepID=A0A843WDT6_COLES|nr:hypothetical protein [Colocasia esculenta]